MSGLGNEFRRSSADAIAKGLGFGFAGNTVTSPVECAPGGSMFGGELKKPSAADNVQPGQAVKEEEEGMEEL